MRNAFKTTAQTIALIAGLGLAGAVLPAAPVQAQSLFSPVIKVNEKAITRYELEQRARMLTLFRAQGDPLDTAREQLIEDSLKMQAAQNLGLVVTEDVIETAMEEFAIRGNMELTEMVNALADAGVAESTFREFVRAGVTWRELVAARFSGQVSVSEDDLERARIALSTTHGVRVLLSEIVLPIPPGQLETVQQRANELAEISSFATFSDAARRYSAAPSANEGGKLKWTNVSELPPPLQPVVLGLAPGEVTSPLVTEQAIILLQLRDIAETDAPAPRYSAIEYAMYYIPGGRSEAALAEAARIKSSIDTCDDLYGVAHGQPPQVLERHSKAPGEIPQDIALQLSQLDTHEVSTALTRANGQSLVFLMMCGRTPHIAGEEEGPTAEELSNFITSRRLESYSDGYLAQLRAEARIIEK